MREIKFRGLDLKGRCFYGLLSNTIEHGWCISNSVGQPFAYPIRPETRAQYTGLKDKNGKEIYEGDIILVQDTYTDKITDDGRGPIEPDNHLLPVEFLGAQFGVAVKERKNLLSPGWIGLKELFEEYGEFEIIGNIYENPDLLSSS